MQATLIGAAAQLHAEAHKNSAKKRLFFIIFLFGQIKVLKIFIFASVFTLKTTADGSTTLVGSAYPTETYHSERGALGEAHHVFVRFLNEGDRVFEVGFGTGLNALLSRQTGLKLHYTAIERYPVDLATIRQLSFYSPVLEALHAAPWNREVSMGERFTLHKIEGDLLSTPLDGPFDTVLFDAFAPDVVPEQWTTEVFANIYAAAAPSAQLLTYSAKGSVRRALAQAGWRVERLEGALGKRHMVRATK